MKNILRSLMIGFLAVAPIIATAENKDPFEDSDNSAPAESKPRIVTEAGKRTLEILRTEKLDAVKLDAAEPQKGFEIFRAALAKRGVIVRLNQYGGPESKHQPSGPLALRNIPLNTFMKYFDYWACWGWILYPDGSITYFDNQCACNFPKDGLYCHDTQYEAGKPEVMAKKQKDVTDKPKAEAAPSDGCKSTN